MPHHRVAYRNVNPVIASEAKQSILPHCMNGSLGMALLPQKAGSV